MLNFPMPYPDELLYSTVARAGVHFGITSPKQLLDEVFNNRKVVATADLPSHIQAISEQYPKSLDLTAETLAYKHTLFPLYAPFIPEPRRLKSLNRMMHCTKGAVHLALGVTTSQIQQKQHFRLCPECMEEQLSKYGEYYWARQWQAAGYKYCLKHAELNSTRYALHNYHRHSFIALAPTTACLPPRSNSPPRDKRIEKRVEELLSLPPTHSPSFEQWNLLYKQVARTCKVPVN
ncbi:MAG: TniQ family protein [Pseudodesulfovibrio sp.]|uniref:TniQ family protein n=1 Tax=Pseudodesulfovibrio TaxID=2035811 RepID=UPI000A066D7D|nr:MULTISPECIES: TniQ family protein [Pseudodesulfovibrio]MBU4516668.1 TniQ family protein [Pseudomonadota bacterium]MBU4522915.1 TniQ family protein [Pseudomonadota bacterium]MBU4557536.1 TniQ family protein [Pseudomonadota bacterium]MBV1765480.1 TniQ family protein [Pseudodesulfovibrio sp.]MBV1773043.1 TniQ family protein [Pseudodesulfovibrio sp.]